VDPDLPRGVLGAAILNMRTWFALLVAPMLALADQSIAYAMSGWACAHQHLLPMHVLHATFLTAAFVGTVASWRLARATVPAGPDDAARTRRRFAAGLAAGSGAIAVLTIAALWVPNWVLSPCFG
jgi:hypothetical protein